MRQEHSISRRASLKSLGAVGAAVVLGGPAVAAAQSELKSAGSAQEKGPVNVVDVATDRFTKGHS